MPLVVLDDTTLNAGADDAVSFRSLSADSKEMVELGLSQRNKMRILSGQPTYASVDAMIDAYMDFEARQKGMTRDAAEAEVLRYLQREALLSEGSLSGDAQDYATFGFLAVLLMGILFSVLTKQV